MRVLIILPTFNEAENIGSVLAQIRDVVPEAHVLVIDDGSPDGTADLADAVGAERGQIEVIRRDRKRGLGTAYLLGFDSGIADGFELLIEMDADLSHEPQRLPALIQTAVDGADLVIGSRYVPGGDIPDWSVSRRMLSKWGNRYAATVLGVPSTDSTSGFRCYRAHILDKIDRGGIRSEGYGFQIELVYRIASAGGDIREIPIVFRDRVLGESKMSPRIVVEAFGLVTLWGVRDRFARVRALAPSR